MTNLLEELQLLENKRLIEQKILTEAQDAISLAKAEFKGNGSHADATWFANTKNVIRAKTLAIHDINKKIKDIKGVLNRSNPKASFFQQAARKILDNKTYDIINNLANEYMNKGTKL